MSGFTTTKANKGSGQLSARFRHKVKDLEKQSLERYQTRENKVVSCVNFCVSALEQLQTWAVFAIFPQDEAESQRYLQFVEYKYSRIIEPLSSLHSVLLNPRMQLEVNQATKVEPFVKDIKPDKEKQSQDALKHRIKALTDDYVSHGHRIRTEVVGKLQKNRRDMATLYKWGERSLRDLEDVLDETLADELCYSLRGKMTRLLATMAEVEEVCDDISHNLISHFDQEEDSHTTDSGAQVTEDTDDLSLSLTEVDLNIATARSEPTPRQERPRLLSRATIDDDSGTPEPPNQPRPRTLLNHPKIMKDKLKPFSSTW